MKKMLICCGVLCMAFLLFCGSAMAADLTATVTEVDKSAVSVTQGADGKYTVTKSSGASADQLYLILFQKVNAGETASVKAAPTKDNVYYMNVEQATGASFTFTAYPKELDAGTYVVYLSDYSANGAATGVATITVAGDDNPEYTLGDVNGKDGITAVDALLAARIAAKNISDLEDWQSLAADVNKKDGVTAVDSLLILKKAANPSLDFTQYQT